MSARSRTGSRGRFAPVVVLIAALRVLLPAEAHAQPAATGGFIETAASTAVRPVLTPAQIQALLPARGPFTFPAPYLTQGVRLTNATDCASGQDCVNDVGYSYWRNINNHVGSNSMYVFLSLDRAHGGGGPTLFSYDKLTQAVTKVGPLFDPSSALSWASGEGWYFSATQPHTLYFNDGPALKRYNVLTRQLTTVFDVSSVPGIFGTNRFIWQLHSSNDDRVHSGTLKDNSSYADLGCFAYREDTSQFFYYPKLGTYDECQIDKSGRYLLIKDNVDGVHGEDNRIINLTTGVETRLLDQNGAGGHSDNGDGYLVAADNWANHANAIKVWKFGQSPLQGTLVYHTLSWDVSAPNHVSHANAAIGVPPEQQYACGSGANLTNRTRANEILCFPLDGSMRVLIVAPVMTDLNAPGGGDTYSKHPKGNLDVTGQYFIWTSNLGGGRLDALIVRVPSQLLTGAPPPVDTIAPTVLVTAPTGGTVSGVITVSANAADNVAVAGVQFKLDGANLGTEDASAPYSVSWPTTSSTIGAHILAAVARDAAGNTTTSAGVGVTVSNDLAAPVLSAVASSGLSISGATITWSTNEASDTQVEYGLTTAYGSTTTLNASLVTNHSQAVTGLAAATLYHYRVKSRDAAGNLATSGDYTFTTTTVTGPGGAPADFDGDAKAEIAVYRPSTGRWFALQSATNYTTYLSRAWGTSTDTVAPADYDGDGRVDLAVYRPSTATWHILTSSTNFTSPLTLTLGTSGDVPVPGDYDRDGKADPAIYRPATGMWAVLKSSENYSQSNVRYWGTIGDVPVPADYDGDRAMDFAVYRPSTGQWYVLESSTNYNTSLGLPWGIYGDVTAPGDYDGDRKADLAVFRPSTGVWYVLLSSSRYSTVFSTRWGATTDLAVPADYDGDGKTDLAVYRPGTSTWYVLKSSLNYTTFATFNWGTSTDVPILRRPQ